LDKTNFQRHEAGLVNTNATNLGYDEL